MTVQDFAEKVIRKLKYWHILFPQETVCSLTAERPTVIPPRMTFGRFSGATSMHRPFQPCMRSTKSEAADLCFIQMI